MAKEEDPVEGVDPRAGPDGILGTEDDVEVEGGDNEDDYEGGGGGNYGDGGGGSQDKDTPHE